MFGSECSGISGESEHYGIRVLLTCCWSVITRSWMTHGARDAGAAPEFSSLSHLQVLCVLPSCTWPHLPAVRAPGDVIVQQSLLLRCCNYVWGRSLSSVHRAGYTHNRCSIKAYWVSERGALIGSAVACRGSPFCHFLRNPLGMWQRGGSSVQGSSVRTSSGSWVPCIQNCTCLRTGLASSGWWARWAHAGQGAPGLQVWLTNSVKERPLHGDSWPLPHPSPLFIHCPSFSPWVSGPQVQNVSTGSISELVSTASYFTDGNWGLETWCSQVLFFYTNSYHMTSSLNNWTSY